MLVKVRGEDPTYWYGPLPSRARAVSRGLLGSLSRYRESQGQGREACRHRPGQRALHRGFPLVTGGDEQPGMPPGRPAPGGGRETGRVVPAGHEQPGDERVGVPHLTGADLVAAPGQRRRPRHQGDQPLPRPRASRHHPRPTHGVPDVRDLSLVGAAHLVAEPPGTAQGAKADGSRQQHPRSAAARAPGGPHLHGVPAGGQLDLQRRVVEVARRPPLAPGDQPLVPAARVLDHVPAGTQGDPGQPRLHIAEAARGRRSGPGSSGPNRPANP